MKGKHCANPKADYYLKYKTSNIFNDDNPQSDKSQNITKKVNSIKYLNKFKPKYNEQEPKQRYFQEYWNINNGNCIKKDLCNKTMDEGLLNNTSLNNSSIKNFKTMGYSSKEKYIKEFFTNNLFGVLPSIHKNNNITLKRSKSSYQCRSKAKVQFCDNVNDNYQLLKLKKIESLASNIFNQKEKEKIIISHNQSIQLNTKVDNKHDKNIEIIEKKCVQKTNTKIPTVFDWKYTNTESYANRDSINRSKTTDPALRKQQELLSTFDVDEVKKKKLKEQIIANTINNKNDKISLVASFSTKSIDVRPNRNLVQRYPQDKEIESYEIKTKKHFDIVDSGKLKQLFLEKGIHVYKFEEDGSSVNGFQSGKITFKIRKDKNDQEIANKMIGIKNEIKALGLDIKKMPNDNQKKKERRQTPGKELIKQSKNNNVFNK